MAGRDGSGDRRAGVSLAQRRLRRAHPRHGIRAGAPDPTDGGDRRGKSSTGAASATDGHAGRQGDGAAADRAPPASGPDPKRGLRSVRYDESPRRPLCAGGRGRGGRSRRGLGPRRPRPPVRDGGVVARRGRARGRGQRSVDDAWGERSWLLARTGSGQPRGMWPCAAPSACVPSARLASFGWSDRASTSR